MISPELDDEPAPKQLTPDLIDECVLVYRTARREADELLSVSSEEPDPGVVDPRDRFAMLALLTWLKTAAG